MAKKLLLETTIKREKGKLYYTATNDKGNLTIWETVMARGKGKKA